MRLICGILHLDGNVATDETLNQMAAAMVAPGLTPMVTRQLHGSLGMGVVDFNGKAGGLANEGGWTLASDIRLNHSKEDPEQVLLSAFNKHGMDFPDHIDGDFAVALWRHERSELWLGRDFIGARPLTWTWQPGRWFAFASLPKGLHGAGLTTTTIDPIAIGCKTSQTYFSGSDSGFTQIAYLQAGHSLCVRQQSDSPPVPHRAYRPDPGRVGTWRGTQEQAASTLRQLIEEAVTTRLPSARPVACHLTGGLDSSTITVLAARNARENDKRVLALSLVTENAIGPEALDERPMIAAVLQQETNIDHLYVHDVLPMPGALSDPDWPDSEIGGADDKMLAAAANYGADRLLSGVGGDEGATYNGANLYAAIFKKGHILKLTRELVARAKSDGIPIHRAVRHRLLAPLLPHSLRNRLRGKPRALNNIHGTLRYLNTDIVESVTQRSFDSILQENTPNERVKAFADHHIPSRCTYYSIMAARHGLAISFPMLDRRVVDFILSLPLHMFLADGQSRQPFRRAMRGVLPERVRLAQHKVGIFDERFILYAEQRDTLLEQLEKIRRAPSELQQRIFDLEAIKEGLEQLPKPSEVRQLIRTTPGALVGGNPPWLPLFAVSCLRVAWQLSEPADQAH